MRRLAMIAFTLACMCIISARAALADDALRTKLAEVGKALSEYEGEVGEIYAAVEALDDAVDAFLGKREELAFARSIDALKSQAVRLEASEFALAGDTHGKIAGLLTALEVIEARRPRTAATRRAASLDKLVRNENQLSTGELRIDGLDALIATLAAVEAANPVKAFRLRAPAIVGLLEANMVDRMPAGDLPALRTLNKTTEAAELRREPIVKLTGMARAMTATVPVAKPHLHVAELRTAIEEAQAAIAAVLGSKAIRIVRARYGVVSEMAHENGRHCDATAAFKSLCSTPSLCNLPNANPGSTLCGFDPAPYAPTKDVALVVTYGCGPAASPTGGGTVQLKTSTTKLSCEPAP